MKSPVFGIGRNWKHRPSRKAQFAPSAANINLRGKKHRRMGCGCCWCVDLREQIRASEHKKYIQEAINE